MFFILLVIIGFEGERSIPDESVRAALARVPSIVDVVSSMFICFDSLNDRCDDTLSLSLPSP